MEKISRKDAAAVGLKVYYTGIACKRGAITERSVRTGWCLCQACKAAIAESKEASMKRWIEKPGVRDGMRAKWAEYGKRYYEQHKDQINSKAKKWAAANKDKARAAALAHYHRNKEALAEPKRARAKKFRDENPAKVRAYIIERRKGRKLATPAWADFDAINKIYKQAKRLEKIDGIKRHVDHVIPIMGKAVCGLHVAENLQILTAQENIAKRNIFEIIE